MADKQWKFFLSFYLIALEAGESKVKVLADSESSEGPLPGSYWVPSSFNLTWGRGTGSFIRALVAFMRVQPS